MRTAVLAAFVSAALIGCASPRPVVPAIADSQFDAIRTITGAPLYAKEGSASHRYRLRAFVDKSGRMPVRWQLYADMVWDGGSWRFYRSASFEDGTQTPATRIASDVQCRRTFCTYSETVGVDLPVARLDGPLRVRINAQAGPNQVLDIPAEYIAEMKASAR